MELFKKQEETKESNPLEYGDIYRDGVDEKPAIFVSHFENALKDTYSYFIIINDNGEPEFMRLSPAQKYGTKLVPKETPIQ